MELNQQEQTNAAATLMLEEHEGARLVRIASGMALVYSAKCPGKETRNEDAAVLVPGDNGSAILAVADGAGGMKAGGEASRLAVEVLSKCICERRAENAELRAAVLDGFEQANTAIRELGVGAATTLAVAEIQDDIFRSYHVGDSLILVVGQRARVKYQTISHSPVGYGVESGFLDEREALFHDDLHVVSNMLGLEDMRIEIGSPFRMKPRDTILIASDGLSDNLHVDEIIECIRKGPLEECAHSLIELSKARMSTPKADLPSKPDDLTFILFRQRSRLLPREF